MKRVAIIALMMFLVLALSAPQVPAAAKHQWKFSNIAPAGQVYTEYFNKLASDITKATNGEVEVTNYPAGELPYKGTDLLKAASKGLVDMADVSVGFVYGEMPILIMPDFPYVALNNEQLDTYRQIILPYLVAELRKRNVEPMTLFPWGPRQIVSRLSTKTTADLKGQKVRTSGGLQDEYIKLWGGIPSFVVWAEVYPAAQRGIVDAVMTATLAIQQSKVYEVCPYFFKIEGPQTHDFILINKQSWDGLSEKNQKIIRKVSEDWQKYWISKVIVELDDVALKEMVEKGQIKNVAELPIEEKIQTQKDMIPILKDYVKKHMQPTGPEAFEKALKALQLE